MAILLPEGVSGRTEEVDIFPSQYPIVDLSKIPRALHAP